MLSAILFGRVSVVVLNSLIYMPDRLPGELQRLFAISTFVVSRALQRFRGCLQMAESFLHVGLIFTESTLRNQEHERQDDGGQSSDGITFHVSSQLFRRIGIDTVAAGPNEEGITT